MIDREKNAIYTRTQFLKQYRDHKLSSEQSRFAEWRKFKVDEDFDPQLFVQRLLARYKGTNLQHIIRVLADEDEYGLSRYLWPKQIPQAMEWLREEASKLNHERQQKNP